MELNSIQDISYWKREIEQLESQLHEFLTLPIPFIENPHLISSLASKSKGEFSEQYLDLIVSYELDSSKEPLNQITQNIKESLKEKLPETDISLDEITQKIYSLAKRKQLGVKDTKVDVYNNNDLIHIWCWELDNYPQPKKVQTERGKIRNIVVSLHKLLNEIKKENPNLEIVSNLHNEYNTKYKDYLKFRENQLEGKRKQEELELQRSLNKAKKEAEKIMKKEENERKKQEKIQKKEEEQKNKELQKHKKIEEKQQKLFKNPNQITLFSESKEKPLNQITKYFGSSSSQNTLDEFSSKTTQSPHLQHTDAEAGNLEEWILQWKESNQYTPYIKPKIIIHYDSEIFPYFQGEFIKLQSNLRRNPFHEYPEINYEIDSEEEYEELHGEDLNSAGELTEEESVDTENEGFVVPDNYLSEDERGSSTEKTENICLNELETKALEVCGVGDLFLREFEAFSIEEEILPVFLISVSPPAVPKEAKESVENYMEELIEIATGKENCEAICESFKKNHPGIPKQSIIKILKSQFTKRPKVGYVYDASKSTTQLETGIEH